MILMKSGGGGRERYMRRDRLPGIAMLLPNIELLQIAGEICKDHSNVIICKRTLNENIETDIKKAVKMKPA